MARREQRVVIPGTRSDKPGHRDDGKVFWIREMYADQAERWCVQVLVLLAEALRTEVPQHPSAAALADKGIDFSDTRVAKALMDPSLDALWDCVTYEHKPGQPRQPILLGENSQIEEISTRARLRMEVMQLHLNFSAADQPRNSELVQKSAA
jgi:hypothetical protein